MPAGSGSVSGRSSSRPLLHQPGGFPLILDEPLVPQAACSSRIRPKTRIFRPTCPVAPTSTSDMAEPRALPALRSSPSWYTTMQLPQTRAAIHGTDRRVDPHPGQLMASGVLKVVTPIDAAMMIAIPRNMLPTRTAKAVFWSSSISLRTLNGVTMVTSLKQRPMSKTPTAA